MLINQCEMEGGIHMLRNTKILFDCLIVVMILTSFAMANQKKYPPDSTLITYNADVMVVGIHNSPCLCESGLSDNFNIIVPKNMSVFVSNDSAYSVNVKVTLKYYSMYRTHGWRTLESTFTLTPRQANREVVFWRNTYYDLIQIHGERPLTAKIEILGKSKIDPKTVNNSLLLTRRECRAYVY
jgi:hypothetical protein